MTLLEQGILHVDDNETLIIPHMQEVAFLSTTMGKEAEIFIENKEHRTYRIIKPHEICGQSCSISLYFKDGILCTVDLSPMSGFIKSWEDATIDNLLKQKAYHDAWLRKVLGCDPPWNYPWGSIASYIDRKSMVGFIAIIYH